MKTRKRTRRALRRPEITESQILAWADRYHERTGRWPTRKSGKIPGSLGENWNIVDQALKAGLRGLPGKSSLAKLLALKRGKRYRPWLPRYTIGQILAWADHYYHWHGRWPKSRSGAIPTAPGETWHAVHRALIAGLRGLPGGSSLPQLLAARRGVRNIQNLPPLRPHQILAWADAHHRRHGRWPVSSSGPIPDAPGESWAAVDSALMQGGRGLPGHSSLAQLLARHRGVRNQTNLPRLTLSKILAWADDYHRRFGRWPTASSGVVDKSGGETWQGIDMALRKGSRGLAPGSSLARLLAQRRGVRNTQDLPPLTIQQILAWADAHHTRTGRWPTMYSGPVTGAPGEAWSNVDAALKQGYRGLPGGSSVALLLQEHRGFRNRKNLPALVPDQIWQRALAHRARTGRWPTHQSGPITDAPGETWSGVGTALTQGNRGLPGGSSLAQLLNQRGRNKLAPRPAKREPTAHKPGLPRPGRVPRAHD